MSHRTDGIAERFNTSGGVDGVGWVGVGVVDVLEDLVALLLVEVAGVGGGQLQTPWKRYCEVIPTIIVQAQMAALAST